MKFWKVKFKNKIYYLCSGNKTRGPIATKKQYKNGYHSYAFLRENGKIYRIGKVIGSKKDLIYIKKVELNPNSIALFNIMFRSLIKQK